MIEILTGNERPSKYWNDLKRKILTESGSNELSDFIGKFKFMASDGKLRATECANRQTLMRILMSVPSPKAEPGQQSKALKGLKKRELKKNRPFSYENSG